MGLLIHEPANGRRETEYVCVLFLFCVTSFSPQSDAVQLLSAECSCCCVKTTVAWRDIFTPHLPTCIYSQQDHLTWNCSNEPKYIFMINIKAFYRPVEFYENDQKFSMSLTNNDNNVYS